MSTPSTHRAHPRRHHLGDLEVAPIGFGAMSLAAGTGPADEALARSVVHAALDEGVTLFDTAEMYGPHHSEVVLGRALAPVRDEVSIATKFGFRLDAERGHVVDGRPETARASLEGSLRRLGVDHVDLYYVHRIDPQVPIEETVGALAEQVQAGRIRHLGLSEPGPDTIRRAHAVHPIAAIQTEWSIFSRDIEEHTVPVARELGIGLVPYSPLGRGLLTGRVLRREDLPERLRTHPRFTEQSFAHNLALADGVREVAAELGAAPGQVALAWLLGQGDDVVPIPGTKQVDRVTENSRAVAVSLDPAQRARLDVLAAAVVGVRNARPAQIGVETPLPA